MIAKREIQIITCDLCGCDIWDGHKEAENVDAFAAAMNRHRVEIKLPALVANIRELDLCYNCQRQLGTMAARMSEGRAKCSNMKGSLITDYDYMLLF